MGIKKRIIPFKWLPGSWGLSGEFYERAEAHYLYDGYELELRLAEIEYGGRDNDGYKRQKIEIDRRHHKIDEYTREKLFAELHVGTPDERAVEEIEVDIRFGKMPEKEGRKLIANIKGEPWIAIVNEGYDPALGPSGLYFEFDWNEHWIEKLRQHGYKGSSEEEIVQMWFQEVCRTEIAPDPTSVFNSGVVYSLGD